MNDCPHCEYHKQRAHRWRVEAYRLGGHTLPVTDAVKVSPLDFVTMTLEKEHLIGRPLIWAEWPNPEDKSKEKNNA